MIILIIKYLTAFFFTVYTVKSQERRLGLFRVAESESNIYKVIFGALQSFEIVESKVCLLLPFPVVNR